VSQNNRQYKSVTTGSYRLTSFSVPSTLICIHPVFAEEKRLENTLTVLCAGSGDTRPGCLHMNVRDAQTAGHNIAEQVKYLRDKYCRRTDDTLTADQKAAIPDTNCFQYSGIFRGERVYWGKCLELE
jgi:hypothetical protein